MVALWVGEETRGVVGLYDLSGRVLFADSTLGTISALVAGSSGAWIASREGEVAQLAIDHVIRRIRGFIRPSGLAVEDGGVVWVADPLGHAIYRLSPPDYALSRSGADLRDPIDVALDGTEGVYVADRGRGGVVHLRANGGETEFFPVAEVFAITRDPLSGQLWLLTTETDLVVLDAAGTEHARLTVGGRPLRIDGHWAP